MDSLKKAFVHSINGTKNFIKKSFNLASGQWFLDKITDYINGPEKDFTYYDQDGLKIYDMGNRVAFLSIPAAVGLFAGPLIGLEANTLLSALGTSASIFAASILIPGHLHALGTTACYGLKKIYNDGTKLIEKDEALEQKSAEASTTEPTKPSAINDDYNGPDLSSERALSL